MARKPLSFYLRQKDAPDWMKNQENAITPETKRELEAMGVVIPDWIKVLPYDSEKMKAAMYVCRAIEEGHPESWKDNLVGKCAICSTRIEYRPSAPDGIMKVCSKCAQTKSESLKN